MIIFLKLYILIKNLILSNEQMEYFPENFIEDDFLIPENDIRDEYQYNLVDAKLLTKKKITFYIKKQGINLDRDDCCLGDEFETLDAWKNNGMESISQLEEIYSNAVFNSAGNKLEIKFPVPKIESPGYTLFHKVWIFDKNGGSPTVNINFNNDISSFSKNIQLESGKKFIEISITYDKDKNKQIVSVNGNEEGELDPDFEFSTIVYQFDGTYSYSPAISLHWTYYKIKIGEANFSLKGDGLCSETNPCIVGYVCVGGICERCHPSCYDCKNGVLSTDCETKCSTHSALLTPDRGSCPYGYADLTQLDSFTIQDLVPPTRNNRLTISYWVYLTSFPENPRNQINKPSRLYRPGGNISNSFDDAVNFTFYFTNEDYEIECGGVFSGILTVLNTWIYIKCTNGIDFGDHFFFIKYFQYGKFNYVIKRGNPTGDGSYSNCFNKRYLEPTDYITVWIENFNDLYNNKTQCNFYIKQLAYFREYVPDPYDNKYFSLEKIFTSTFELPEVLFIIPFDELIRNDNKYDVKCYSYAGSILEHRITLTPYYYNKNYSYYPPKLFKRLNLLERNKKYTSPDLIKIEDVLRDNNTLIASYDYAPLTCIDNYFLTYDDVIFEEGQDPNPNYYKGKCTFNCDKGRTSMYGLSESKGFCNTNCYNSPSDPICLSNNYDLINLRSKFQCQSGYFGIFHNCDKDDIEIEKNNVIYFNHDQGFANIVMDVINYNLKSYIIEFWIYMKEKRSCTEVNYATYYLFYTNQFQMYIKNEEIPEEHFFIKTDINQVQKEIFLKRFQWNHFIFQVYYDPKNGFNQKSIMYMIQSQKTGIPNKITNSENPLPLEYIYFCNGRKSTCNNIGITWYCAYYKNLRLFNGDLAERHVTFRYDEYYSDYKYLLSSIYLYYPLYGHYIANNLLSQYNSKLSALNTNSATNNWNFNQYAYCTITVTGTYKTDCVKGYNNMNCDECFDNDHCYQCKSNNYFLFKEKGDKIYCQQKANKRFVLRLPSKANFELTPLKGLNHAGATVNFYIKIYGFTIGNKIDVVYLGDHLKINYNADINSPYYGLNLVTFKESSEIVVSNYYDFRQHFGLWTFISVSSYDKSNENFFPPMVRFEINNKKMSIIGPLDNLSIGTIKFANELFALVQRVKVYNTYMIGNHFYETHSLNAYKNINVNVNNYLMGPATESKSYFEPVEDEDNCRFDKFGLIATDKEDENLIIPYYECVHDDIKEIYYNDIFLSGSRTFYYFLNNHTSTSNSICHGDCDNCIGNTKYDCSCNYINNEEKIFLGNVSNHFCKKLSYINFAKAEPENDILVKSGGNKFTLHFWVFAYSYVDKVFEGINVEWQGHTTVQVGLNSNGKYFFTCLINGEPTRKYVDFNMNTWNFLHCAVNYESSKFFITTENEAYEHGFTYTDIPVETTFNQVLLKIKDLTSVKDWGYLFYRYIRLWKDGLRYSSFLSRIEIKETYFSSILLHQWDTKFRSDHVIESTQEKASYNFKLKYSLDKIGTNIVPEEIYQEVLDEPYLCSDKGQYYDRKTKECINFTDISNIQSSDIEINKVDVAYSHNYGIAFWILMENHTDITVPINVTWQYHMILSLQYVGSSLKAFCFPQYYKPYSVILDDDSKSPEKKTTEVLNSATNEYTDDLSGVWTWFQCSLTYNNRYFYLNENKQNLIIETLYKEGNIEYKNDEPFGHFYNDMTDSLSKLKIRITGNRKASNHYKIYLRCLYLFKDFLPYNYNFKYMDLYRIEGKQFPPLALAINFAEFIFETGSNLNIKYKYFNSIDNKENNGFIRLRYYISTRLELAANFVFLPLCNPRTKEKYNAGTQLCQEIENCDLTALNALYCMEEYTPLICKTNYYINIDQNENKVECLNYCKDNKFFRSPGTEISQGICGTDCLSSDDLKTCPNSASSILTYENDFECNQGFYRIGYQCFRQPTNTLPNKGALFYSGFNFPYNIYQEFTQSFTDQIQSGYVLEFWFMIDNTINTDFKVGEEYYYFNANPHEVYLKNDNADGLNYYYRFKPLSSNVYKLTDLIHKYEWNKILIFADNVKETILIYVNFNKAEKIPVTASGDLKLKSIAFCSNKGSWTSTLKYPKCTSSQLNIKWASAYYNNIRVWDILISTIDTIQSFVNEIYTEHPQSLVLFYPLTINYLDNNKMTNIMYKLEEHITINCPKASECTIYNKDNIIIYNYSSKFDWGLLHKKQFVNSMDGLQIDPNDQKNNCNEHCIRCYKTDDISKCYECETGYVLQYQECKDARKLYFLKTPSGTAGASIYFRTLNKENKDFCALTSFTLVIWMKFFGVKYPTLTEFCKILGIDANTYLAFHRTTNDLVVVENSKIAFRDKEFRNYFGVWIPISIANYISNSINDIYPNMFTLSVNKRDIPFSDETGTEYQIPASGIKVTELSLGYEIISLFAELSIYSKFIQGGYGRIRSEIYLTDQFYYKSLTGTKINDCLVTEDDLLSPIALICAPDYSVNFIDSYYCKDDTKFYEPYDEENDEIFPDENKCKSCDATCNTLCFGSSKRECTCDMTHGIFWLRRAEGYKQTYCEHIYYLDFSNINPYTFYKAPITKTQEYTIEFWLYVYSYREISNFKELYLEWNFHNKITLYIDNNSLKVDCQPIWRSYDFPTALYSDVKSDSLQHGAWAYVKCGTDLKNKKYFLNSITEYDLKTKKENFFNFNEIDSPETTSDKKFFKIYRSEDFYNNFGFVFLREIKLWQQYNLDYLDSKRIYFDMNEITKEEIKKNFPGLLLYYKNLWNLTQEGNSVIKEELSATETIVAKSPDYLGYNIVRFEGDESTFYLDLELICPYGHVWVEDYTAPTNCKCAEGFTEIGNKCVPQGDELDALCEIYSNKEKQCFQCKDNNQYLNKWVDEFGAECYTDCPPTLYEDPLINQCRRCHETCYECTNEFYNNCTSCTGTLYFNFKENTCIPNCQTADLTRSLTKPNICVIFDADAILKNVNVSIPIDVNTFDNIEAEIILPTSPEYDTLWLFDAELTNKINRELGFTDDIPLDSEPFIGDKTKLDTPLNHSFFKTQHKYAFGMEIYAQNKGLKVSVYVWWNLTMNSPPFGGKVTIMPYLGLFNTTTFIMRCVDYQDENTPQEDLEYYFYYVEANTNLKIKLSDDFSINNEVYSNFTVRYYQLEYSNITIYCQVRDKWGATSESSNVITIVNKKNSPLYVLKQLVASFILVEDALTDVQLLARSEVLMSLGINPYTDRVPNSYFTTYESSLTGEKVVKVEPQCVSGYCNDNGDCEVIDVALTCKCTASYMGKQCFLDKNGYADLSSYYLKMHNRLRNRLSEGPINDDIFKSFYILFFAAQNFFTNDTFFIENLVDFRNYLKTTETAYITSSVDKFNKILDLDEFFFNYFYVRETQIKLTTKINEGYPFRNKTLTMEDSSSYQGAINQFFALLDEDTKFLISEYGNDYDYSCQHFIYHLKKIDENFDDKLYFESLKTVLETYKPTILFMNCLKQKHPPPFNYYLNYIEYLVNPMSFDSNFYPNVTSPFVTIKIYDYSGNEVVVNDCSSTIKINMPFHGYDWINYINEQKWLFAPENYKLEDDPIFRDPIFIYDNGSVSDDTVAERIAKYYRYYNIVGLVHTPTSGSLYEYTTFLFKNISDTFFLLFETNHLSSFSSMLIPNIMNFVVDGRFFYVTRYMVFLYYQNHINNPAFYIITALLIIFIFISLIYKCKDYSYFDNLEILDFLQKEIIKSNFAYDQIDPGLNDENIFKIIPHVDPKLNRRKMKQIRTMFDEYDIEEVDENAEEENEDNISDIMKNDNISKKRKSNANVIKTTQDYNGYNSTARRFKNETKGNNDDENEEKKTEIKSNRKKKEKIRQINRERDIENPPKKKTSYFDGEEPELTLQAQLRKKKEFSEDDNDFNDIENINKTYSTNKRMRLENNRRRMNDDEKDKGYGDNEEDFDEKKLEKMSSDKSTIRNQFRGAKQNFDLQSLNSKLGLNETKYSKFSKFSGASKMSKKSYFVDKDKTKANFVSLQKFHNKSYKLNIYKDALNKEEERKRALEEYTRLSVTPFEFFKYNLRTRHILVAPFINLTLFNNRWKKLMVLLTQFYIQQLTLTVYLTYDEKIVISNFVGMILASLIAGIVSNILVYMFVFLFGTDTYERMRLYRLVMSGEQLAVYKGWTRIKRINNCKVIFGIIISVIFWLGNFYMTLVFTAVWKVQRSAWIVCFIITLFLDLAVGEICVEGLCAFLYSKRLKYNLLRNIGETFNRLRSYRTMWP